MRTIAADELPRFMACNGSRLLGGALPPNNGEYSLPREEGTAAHYMMLQAMNKTNTIEEMVDRKAPNGVYMTSDMAEHVQDVISELDRVYVAAPSMEYDTSFSDHANWNVAGRADFIGITAPGGVVTLHIDDLKYGWRIVEPERHWTLIAHAIGYCQNTNLVPHKIEFTIHQPRPYHPDGPSRSWAVTYDEMMLLSGELTSTLSNPSDELRTSAECNKCKSLAICPAARKASMNAIDAADMAFEDTVDNDLLAFNLDTLNRAADMIKNRKEAFEELAKHRIKAGQIVDNYSVEMGLGNRKWKEGIDASVLAMLTGKELSRPKLVTPSEAERLNVSKAVVASITERLPSGIKLVRVNANKKASRIFKKG